MNFEYKKCPICGSSDILLKKSEEMNGNTINYYYCRCCSESFSTKAQVEKEMNLLKKSLEEKSRLEEMAASKAAVSFGANDIYRHNTSKVIEIYCEFDNKYSSGTGIIIKNGYVLTNAHIIFDRQVEDKTITNLCYSISGRINKQSNVMHGLEFVFADKEKDIALLQFIEGYNEYIELENVPVETGEQIYAIGNSKGQGMCMVEGIVSDARRIVNNRDFIMISAPVTTGNSGGPLFNSRGQLIGMVTSGRSDTSAMNFAIPNDVLLDFLHRVEEDECIEIFQ